MSISKIVYIAGEGRSGSTILEGILSNAAKCISLGESNRFAIRYIEGTSHCGCTSPIRECALWSRVYAQLQIEFPTVKIEEISEKVQEIQKYKNFARIPELIRSGDWQHFSAYIKRMYSLVSECTGKPILLDSSKNMNWAYLLHTLNFCELKMVYIIRNLTGVANSWKKTLVLPEYPGEVTYMPIKNNRLILKSHLKVRLLGRRLNRRIPILKVSYQDLCRRPEITLQGLTKFTGLHVPKQNFVFAPNHAIGGNPVRYATKKSIRLQPVPPNAHLTLWDRIFFAISGALIKWTIQ